MSVHGRDIDHVVRALRRWLEREQYASYDPYDGASGSFPWSLARRNRLIARGLMQVVKRSPVNLRPLLGIPKRVLTKSVSDLASAAVLQYRATGDSTELRRARTLLARLEALALPGYTGACWGLSTPYFSRFVTSRGNDPNLFWTVNAANAFLDAYEVEGSDADLRIARSTVDFIRNDLGVVDEAESGVWFPYFIGHEAVIYNVTAMGGALLQRIAHHTHEPDIAAIGRRAMTFVVRHQNVDGSWNYARSARGEWVDGFHTAYVIESLLQDALLGGSEGVAAALHAGVKFYVERMFTSDDVPRYTINSTYPIEIQNCAQAIQTLARLCWIDHTHLDHAERVAAVVIRELYRETNAGTDPTGYFMMSRGRWFVNRLPAVRWGQAPMALALASLQAARRGLAPTYVAPRAAT